MLHTEFIPAADKNSRRLMVMLHGLGDSLEGYRWWPEALGFPWLNHLLVNAPDEFYGGYSWYDHPGDQLPGIRRSTKLLFALLDELRAKNFPADQIMLGGFSQGCLMSLEVALRYPHRLAGVVGISGYVCEPDKLLTELSPVARSQKIMMTHGPLDPVIPFDFVKKQHAQLVAAGLDVVWHEFNKAHTIAGEAELAVIRDFIRARFDA
jgi:phospholipase/carboxylesterase